MGILHDVIPHPNDRIGFPMHVKVIVYPSDKNLIVLNNFFSCHLKDCMLSD